MPVPAVPRRAAPPRKKAYKSPSASQLAEVPVPTPVPEATEEAPDTVPTEEHVAESTPEPELESVAPSSLTKVTSHETVEGPEQVPLSEEILIEGDVQKEIGEVGKSTELDTDEAGPEEEREEEEEQYYDDADEPKPEPEQESREEEDEEQEEERRKRVAAKLLQMGAINPLARPPPVPHRESISSPTARHDSVPPPVPTEKPLDVEDEVNVDLEEVGESVPSPPPALILPQAHIEDLEEAEEAREADKPASRAGES